MNQIKRRFQPILKYFIKIFFPQIHVFNIGKFNVILKIKVQIRKLFPTFSLQKMQIISFFFTDSYFYLL